jgi:zinc transporter ZupT
VTGNISYDAFLFGIISAVSLPLGAILAIFWKPKQKIIAIMMAFGAGALLAALTIDLVAESLEANEFYPLAAGCIFGGILYELLNRAVNKRGGALRKKSTILRYLHRKKVKELKIILQKLSNAHFFHHFPHDEIHTMIPLLSRRHLKKGEILFKKNEPAKMIFLLESGEIVLFEDLEKNKRDNILYRGDIFGEHTLNKNEPYPYTAVAGRNSVVWILNEDDLNLLVKNNPRIADGIRQYFQEHPDESPIMTRDLLDEGNEWAAEAIEHVHAPSHQEITNHVKANPGAALAIWLGILLDGIPESFVIGSSLLIQADSGPSISLSLLAGLFLSNFPEALSSSTGMRENKYSSGKILLLWTSIMIVTGIGAYFGSSLFTNASSSVFAIVDGVAAGAMLTMIAETMLPEAFHRGGTVTGISTLMGFLTAILFSVLG